MFYIDVSLKWSSTLDLRLSRVSVRLFFNFDAPSFISSTISSFLSELRK